MIYPPLKKFYDRTTAARLARGAAAAYGAEKEMRAWAEEMECGRCEIIRDADKGTQLFVAQADDAVMVCFRGIVDLRNWLIDLDCRRQPWEIVGGEGMAGVAVHEGFQNALAAVWPRLKNIIYSMMPGRKRIWFTGHSLGGALAMLAAARWQAETSHAPAWVYTFGQPRAGNAAWARWYDALLKGQTFRVIHADDVVARVPWLLQMYRHCGTEIFYPAGPRSGGATLPRLAGASPHLIDCPWWRKTGSDLSGLWQELRQGKIALLTDHRVETYLRLCGDEGTEKTRGRKEAKANVGAYSN